MEVTLKFELDDCRQCVLRANHYGHGENWDYCRHPKAPSGYGNIIETNRTINKTFPSWCPFLKSKE